MPYVPGLGAVSRRERYLADRFYDSLTGASSRRRARPDVPPYEQTTPARAPAPAPAPAPVRAQQPYLPAGGRNYVPQAGVFNCTPGAFVVIGASFLPERTADPGAAIDAALTAAGLEAAQRGRITRSGLTPIASEFGAPALTELFARLRWSADDIATWGSGADSMLVPRLLIHIPGHFRELARRAPDPREAFVLECLGWLLMRLMRDAVAAATRRTWWVPPRPSFVTVVPNPIPPVSADVSRLLVRHLLIDTAMTAGQWNGKLTEWGNSLAGKQWQAELSAPQPGRPFYAGLATIPAHVSTAAVRANFKTGWDARVAETDARHAPLAADATTVTLAALLNAIELRECQDSSPHIPAGARSSLDLQGLQLTAAFPSTRARTVGRLTLTTVLHPVFRALFQTIKELGWNDLLYHTEGSSCFRGIRHGVAFKVMIGGTQVSVRPFNSPNAATVTQINTNLTPVQRGKVIGAVRVARNMSEHGLGAAIDFNVSENGQRIAARPFGSMDPRIVALFEAFHFRFGACFSPTDPMHFEYCRAPCAPAPAAAGTLGPVVPTRQLLPTRATRVIA